MAGQGRHRRRPAHPPFCGERAASGGTADFCTRDGAYALAERIRTAWARIGIVIGTEVAPVTVARRGATREHLWTVRMPDLVNGLPVRKEVTP